MVGSASDIDGGDGKPVTETPSVDDDN